MHRQREKRGSKHDRKQDYSCWCCRTERGQVTLNIFGVDRPLCHECYVMGEIEIEREGRINELFGLVNWDGLVSKKHRRKITKLAQHSLKEVSILANECLQEDDWLREISYHRRHRNQHELKKTTQSYDLWLDGRQARIGEVALRLE